MTLRIPCILLALATLGSLPACDPVPFADDEASLADDDDAAADDADAAADLTDLTPVQALDGLAPSCEGSCLERTVQRCNGDVMGHCTDAAMLDDVLACITEECGGTDSSVAGPDDRLAPASDPVGASMCTNVCQHEAELDEWDCYAAHGTPTQCKRVRTNSFNICYYDNCCSIWDYNCTPPKV